ncbi:MAG: hypothetical protein LBH43_02290 [Treponema sp.]|nr:hypothetical protein [Treponema sp.]
MSENYRGLKKSKDNYYIYLAFFESQNGELFLKVGKSGSLFNRFRDLQKANPLKLYKSYVIDVEEFDFVADAMEYIFKRRLSPFNTTGEWFYVTEQVMYFLKYIIQIINVSQEPDEEIWENNSFGEYFSLIGHRSEKDWPFDYDWDEIFRNNNCYKIQEVNYNLKDKRIKFLDTITIDELIEILICRMKSTGYKPTYSINMNPDFDFRNYFSENESGKERKEWWKSSEKVNFL